MNPIPPQKPPHSLTQRRTPKQNAVLLSFLLVVSLSFLVPLIPAFAQNLPTLLMSLLLPIPFSAPLIASGIFLFSLVREGGHKLAGLTIPATMLVVAGTLLFLSPLLSWMAGMPYVGIYLWPLVFPTALGLGISFYGDITRGSRIAQLGEELATLGLWFFGVGLLWALLSPTLWPIYAMLLYVSLLAWVYRLARPQDNRDQGLVGPLVPVVAILPLLLLVSFEVGQLFNLYWKLSDGARDGARYAAITGLDPFPYCADIRRTVAREFYKVGLDIDITYYENDGRTLLQTKSGKPLSCEELPYHPTFSQQVMTVEVVARTNYSFQTPLFGNLFGPIRLEVEGSATRTLLMNGTRIEKTTMPNQ